MICHLSCAGSVAASERLSFGLSPEAQDKETPARYGDEGAENAVHGLRSLAVGAEGQRML